MLTTSGGKEETTKAEEKAKATTKEAKAKASTGAKEGITRAREKASQDPKDMDQGRATKAKETTAKRKQKQQLHDMPPMWQAWPLGPGLQVWHIGEGEEPHPLEQEQADQDNNEELPQDVNDAWDWYYEGEEGQHEVNYMDENWNDYDYDNSWGCNDNSYEDTANYIGGINESSPLDTSDKQSHYYISTNPSHYSARKQHTQHHGTTTARAFNNSSKKTQYTALRHSSSNTTTKEQED